MKSDKNEQSRSSTVDYSAVTAATGLHPDNKPIADSLANQMPTSDSPGVSGSFRVDPDKTIPGPEAATGVDEAEEDVIARKKAEGR